MRSWAALACARCSRGILPSALRIMAGRVKAAASAAETVNQHGSCNTSRASVATCAAQMDSSTAEPGSCPPSGRKTMPHAETRIHTQKEGQAHSQVEKRRDGGERDEK